MGSRSTEGTWLTLGTKVAMFFSVLVLVAAPTTGRTAPIADSSRITAKQLELGLALLQRSDPAANIVVSPYSIHSGLTLARIGAVGITGASLDSVLFPSPFSAKTRDEYSTLNNSVTCATDSSIVSLANSVWISNRGSFTKPFLSDTSKAFQAEARTINFQQSDEARITINAWVSDKTHSLIPHLLPPGMPQPNTTATLVNALYFKGAWDTPFQREMTKNEDFWLEHCETTQVPSMHLTRLFPYYENKDWQAVSLPYAQGDYSYLILLPHTRQKTSAIAQSLSPQLFSSVLESSQRSRINLSVPKHKIKQSRDLIEAMQSLGVTVPFSSQADFSAMTPLPVSISAIIHEAVIAVDEVGTEAAAATAVVMAKSALFIEDEPKEMKVDRPFAFAIFHNESRAPLFIGVVGDPRPTS